MWLKLYLICLIILSLFACAEIGQEAKSGFQEKMFDGDYAPALVNEAEVFGESVISQSTEDFCEQLNWYGDGYCDTYCSQPDPDCNQEVASPWVNQEGNQAFNESSQERNPWLDSNVQTPTEEETQDPNSQDPTPQDPTPQDPTPQDPTPQDPTPQDPTPQDPTPQDSWNEDSNPEEIFDQCPIEADDLCDENCPMDIDCDLCAQYGFYGDGYCDEDCFQPDSDCL